MRQALQNAVTRDEVVTELNNQNITHEVFDFRLTDKQKHIIEREGVTNDNQIDLAINKRGELLDRALVNDASKEPIANAIQQIKSNDPDLGTALSNVYEIITGETPQETIDRL